MDYEDNISSEKLKNSLSLSDHSKNNSSSYIDLAIKCEGNALFEFSHLRTYFARSFPFPHNRIIGNNRL